MNLTLRKLALLEKNLEEKEQIAKLQGYCTNTIDSDFKNRVSTLLEKVRTI